MVVWGSLWTMPSLLQLLSLNLACLTSSCLSIKLHLDLTTLPLHYSIHPQGMRDIDSVTGVHLVQLENRQLKIDKCKKYKIGSFFNFFLLLGDFLKTF